MFTATNKDSDFSPREVFENKKLLIKNEPPKTTAKHIQEAKEKTLTRMATNFGFKPPAPPIIHMLASLHKEAKYKIGADIVSLPPPACPWKAAEAYVALKDQEVDANPGHPLPKRGGSMDSISSMGSKKSVRFAEIEAEVRIFENDLPEVPENIFSKRYNF